MPFCVIYYFHIVKTSHNIIVTRNALHCHDSYSFNVCSNIYLIYVILMLCMHMHCKHKLHITNRNCSFYEIILRNNRNNVGYFFRFSWSTNWKGQVFRLYVSLICTNYLHFKSKSRYLKWYTFYIRQLKFYQLPYNCMWISLIHKCHHYIHVELLYLLLNHNEIVTFLVYYENNNNETVLHKIKVTCEMVGVLISHDLLHMNSNCKQGSWSLIWIISLLKQKKSLYSIFIFNKLYYNISYNIWSN